jgi:hypothetical protein
MFCRRTGCGPPEKTFGASDRGRGDDTRIEDQGVVPAVRERC